MKLIQVDSKLNDPRLTELLLLFAFDAQLVVALRVHARQDDAEATVGRRVRHFSKTRVLGAAASDELAQAHKPQASSLQARPLYLELVLDRVACR